MRPLVLLALLFLSSGATSQERTPTSSFGVTLGFPWINSFAYYNYNTGKADSKTGFVGISGSAFYKDGQQKISLSIGVFTAIPVPFGPYDPDKNNFTMVGASFLEGTYHRRILPRLNLVGGLHYMEHVYTHYETDSTQSDNFDDYTGGLTAGTEYLFGRKNFSLAVFYRPSLITFTGTKKYRHVISLDARIDINIFRKF